MAIDFIPSSKIDFQPVRSQIQKPKPSFRTEVMAPIAHAASALSFDIPRTTMEMQRLRGEPGAEQAKEFLYPEQQTLPGKILRFGLEAPATVFGGAGKLATKAFTKMAPVAAKGMLGKVAQGAASGATYGALQTKPTAREYGDSLLQTTVGGAVLPVAGKAISRVGPAISGFGKTIVSKGAGLSKTAMDTVSRLGFKKVREVADKGVNYIQEDIIPRARQSLIKNITSAGEASKELLQDMGFNPDQIKSVMKISKQNMNKYGKMVNESWVKTEENLGKALTNVGKQIGDVYAKAAKEGQKINIKNTIGTMRKQLRGLGVVDDAGNLLGDYKTHPSSAIRNLAQIYSEYAPRIGKGDISVPDFLNFRTRLQASIVKFPEGEKFNVPIYITNKVLKEDSINSLIQKGSPYEKFWRDLNKEYSDLETLDYLTKKITTVANNLPNKILTQRNKLTEKHMKLYGKDIVNDVDAYNAARELYPEKETFSIFNPQKPLIRGAYKGSEMLKESARPVTTPIGRTAQKIGQFGANRVQQFMEAPLVSPKTKSFFAEAPSQVGAKLKGKSGQAVFSREEPQKPVFGVKPQEPTLTPIQKPIVQPAKDLLAKQGIVEGKPKDVKEIMKSWDTKGIENWISEKGDTITLSKIIVPKNSRGKGVGTKAIQELIDYADINGKKIYLTPTKDFGGSVERLNNFYKDLGFIKNKSYSHQETLVRHPMTQGQKSPLTAAEAVKGGKVLYHGTDAEFETFDLNKSKAFGKSKFGHWFTEGKEFAGMFGKNIKEATVDLKNPKVISKDQWDDIRGEHAKDGEWFKSWKNELINQGHDGLKVEGKKEMLGKQQVESPTIFAAFNDAQVKSTSQPLTAQQAVKQGVGAEESPSLYHEKGNLDLVNSISDATGLNVSTVPELALGQSGKGVVYEFDKSVLLREKSKSGVGFLRNIKKAGTDFIGQKEFEVAGGQIQPKAIKSITIKQGTKLSAIDIRKMNKQVELGRFKKEVLGNGDIKYTNTESQLLSEYEAAKGVQGKGTASGIAGLTAAGTAMARQAQAGENKEMDGEVSTYGWDAKKEHLNERTANNEKFDPNGLTAAMWDIPFGTKVKVTDKKTGKSVVVRINDRGPAKRLNRPIDLSRGAWKVLGYEKPGLIQAKIEVLKTD